MSDKTGERNNIISINNQFKALNQQDQVEEKAKRLKLLTNFYNIMIELEIG